MSIRWRTFPAVLAARRHVSPSIFELTFCRADGARFEYQAGQFVNVHFEVDGEPVHRSYSVAVAPGGDTFAVAVSPVTGGQATELFTALQPGDAVDISGPYGRFVLRDEKPRRLVLAGTGTGITPYRAMLPELEARVAQEGLAVDLLLGVWQREEALYSGEFLAAAARHAAFNFHACYSRAMPPDPASHEHSGYIQTRFEQLDLSPDHDVIYLCGNPGMIDAAVVMLKAAGFSTASLRREKYLPSRS